MERLRTRILTGLLPLLLLLQWGCATNHYTGEGRYLLVKQKVKGNDEVSTAALEGLYRQESTSRFYLFFYYLGDRYFYDSTKVAEKIEATKAKYDRRLADVEAGSSKALRIEQRRTKKLDKLRRKQEEGNWLMRVVGQAPVYFDSTEAGEAATQMSAFIYNKGFYDNRVTYDPDTGSKPVIKVTYNVEENDGYYIRELQYLTDDTAISRIIDENQGGALLEVGQRYDEANLAAERDRIDKLLRNRGYYGFSREYVFYDVYYNIEDSTAERRVVDINLKIKNPVNGEHRVYTFDRVLVRLNAEEDRYRRDTVRYDSVIYTSPAKNFPVTVLDRKLQFKPGDIYRLRDVVNTQGQLGSMDMFKFVNMGFDTTGNRLRARIATSPLPKYQITDELGLLVSQGAPGPFANITFKVRNLFKGYEVFEISTRYSLEGQISGFAEDDSVYRAQEIGVNASLVVPLLLIPTKLRFTLSQYNPKTRFLLGYTDVRRPEFNQRLIRGTMTYLMQLGPFQALTLSPIDLNLADTISLSNDYRTFLLEQQARGNPLIQSFDRSLVSSLSGSYTFNNSQVGAVTRSFYVRVNAEVGGMTAGLIDDVLLNNDGSVGNLNYFQFHRTDVDARYYYPLSRKTTIATRLRAGLAQPWGDLTETLPYQKFFFAGGGNSIRAWQPRRLGPGSVSPEDTDDDGYPNYVFEQPGEIIIESSIELRQKLFSVVEGALFVDAGNVWNNNKAAVAPDPDLPPSPDAEDAKFKFNRFYRQLAVGVGAGLRLDFSFLIVRLDYGIKTLDPAQPRGERFVLDQFSFNDADARRYLSALQIGIGYPF
ncbi:MAG: BamA/TamA family outer membrane protein [Catalinimonas sp.]